MKKLLIALATTVALVSAAHAGTSVHADEQISAAVMKDRIDYCNREAKKIDVRVGPRWRNKSRPTTKREYESIVKSCLDGRWWDEERDEDQ